MSTIYRLLDTGLPVILPMALLLAWAIYLKWKT